MEVDNNTGNMAVEQGGDSSILSLVEPTVVQAAQETATPTNQPEAVVPPANVPNDPEAMKRGMNEAQRKAAELEKQLQSYEVSKAEIEKFNQLKQFLQMTAQAQGPEAALQILANQMGISVGELKEQATQAEEPTETNEYANEPWYKSLRDELRKEALAEVAPIKQRYQQEEAQNNISKAEEFIAKITPFIGDVDTSYDGPVWDYMTKTGLYPEDAPWAVIQAKGGLDSFVKTVKEKAITEYLEQAKKNNTTTAPTLGNPGNIIPQNVNPQGFQLGESDEAYNLIMANRAAQGR
jgi:hypothetical protein